MQKKERELNLWTNDVGWGRTKTMWKKGYEAGNSVLKLKAQRPHN